MKKLLFCMLAFLSLHSYGNEINVETHEIDEFIITHIKPLSAHNIQLFANLVYLSYALAAIDSHVRDSSDNLLEYAWATRQASQQYADTTTDLMQLQIVAENLDLAIQTQLTILKSWKLCTTLIEKLEENDPLAQAADIFKNNVQEKVKHLTISNKATFNNELHQSSVALQQAAQTIHVIANTYSNLSAGTIPLNQPEDYQEIAKIIIASKTSCSIEEQCQNAFNIARSFSQNEVNLQRVSARIFLLYYKAMYLVIQELEPTYRTILFNDQGVIPAEKRTELLPNI